MVYDPQSFEKFLGILIGSTGGTHKGGNIFGGIEGEYIFQGLKEGPKSLGRAGDLITSPRRTGQD